MLSGPNLAREIAAEKPTATVVACADHDLAIALQSAIRASALRPYPGTDVVGCGLRGARQHRIRPGRGGGVAMGGAAPGATTTHRSADDFPRCMGEVAIARRRP